MENPNIEIRIYKVYGGKPLSMCDFMLRECLTSNINQRQVRWVIFVIIDGNVLQKSQLNLAICYMIEYGTI